jgi:hypothetical protein
MKLSAAQLNKHEKRLRQHEDRVTMHLRQCMDVYVMQWHITQTAAVNTSDILV